jgi:cell division septation protein DedD
MAAMRGRQPGSRTGTFLVLAGIGGVLTATFIAGVWTGHNWPVITGSPRPPVAAEPAPTRRAAAAADRSPRAPDTLPALTFYHDLTAPLTAPPPPSKPAKPARVPEPRREEPARAEAAPVPAPPLPRAELPPPAESGTRFTVQVAAYNARPPAEVLRATLSAAGHDARILETASGSGVRYRVQVGSFPTREAAREVGVRLAAERAQPTFVTTR